MSIMSIIIIAILVVIITITMYHFRTIWKDHSNFSNITVGLCTILTVLWGAYTFDALNQRDKAAAELQEIQDRIKGTESTLFSINITEESGDDGFYILPVVNIKNNGTEPIHIGLDEESLTIQRVKIVNDKVKALDTYHPNFYEVISDDKSVAHTPMYDLIIPISAERNISYALHVKKPGLYYLTFKAKTVDKNGHEDLKVKNGKPIIWFTSKYVYIK